MMKKLTRKISHGLVAVEMALVLPLLLMLTMGAVRYGHLFLRAQQITNAARNGARIAILPDSDNTDVMTMINNLMVASGMGSSGYNVALTPGDVTTPAVGDSVTVQITVPVANLGAIHAPILTDLEPANWNLGGTVTMAKEGF